MPRYEIYWTATGITEIDAADPTAAADQLTDSLFTDDTQSVAITTMHELNPHGLITAVIDPESIWPVEHVAPINPTPTITPLTFTEEI